MVVKRQCTFCAGEIEPGTGTLYVKRDGSVFQFCSSSCRKQQLHLGRVGHRLKWTRAHAMKRAAEHSSATARGRTTSATAASTAPARPRVARAEEHAVIRPGPSTEAAGAVASAPQPVSAEGGATTPKAETRPTEGVSTSTPSVPAGRRKSSPKAKGDTRTPPASGPSSSTGGSEAAAARETKRPEKKPTPPSKTKTDAD